MKEWIQFPILPPRTAAEMLPVDVAEAHHSMDVILTSPDLSMLISNPLECCLEFYGKFATRLHVNVWR